MTTKEYAKVIASNLKRLAFTNEKTQMDIARDLNLNQSTLSGWMNGTRTPKMDKIDMLCDYFKCSREDIMEPHNWKSDLEFVGKINPLSTEEIQIARAYRDSDDSIKKAVRVLLGLESR